MVKNKKCCVCGGRNKKSYDGVGDMADLMTYLEVKYDTKFICYGCSREKRRLKYSNDNSHEVR